MGGVFGKRKGGKGERILILMPTNRTLTIYTLYPPLLIDDDDNSGTGWSRRRRQVLYFLYKKKNIKKMTACLLGLEREGEQESSYVRSRSVRSVKKRGLGGGAAAGVCNNNKKQLKKDLIIPSFLRLP